MTRLVSLYSAVAICFLLSCDFFRMGPEGEDLYTQQYSFAAQFLDSYLIYREKLPQDLYVFPSPESLYAAVKEPYTTYYDSYKARQILSSLTTEVSGGIGIRIDSVHNGYGIRDVFPKSPGAEAGLQRRDTILQVNGKSITGTSWAGLSKLLSGAVGSVVTLRIQRWGQSLDITVTRGRFSSPSVFIDTLDSTIAYIHLLAFLSNTNTIGGSAQEFKNALDATDWADYTILDLQGNGGGEINQCVSIAGELVPSGTPIIRFRERIKGRASAYTHDTVYHTDGSGSAANRNLIVLVDRRTASASEMLLSCIKNKRPEVRVIGDTTYGKARGQILGLGPDSVLAKVTYATLLPFEGESYDLVGIAPDIFTGDEAAQDVAISEITGEPLAKLKAQHRNSAKAYTESGTKMWVPLAVRYQREEGF